MEMFANTGIALNQSGKYMKAGWSLHERIGIQ